MDKPPTPILAKSVYVALSNSVKPTFGGAGWLLNLTQNRFSNSYAKSLFSVPSSKPLL